MSYSSSIETDLHNPGQFFACCGLLYCADRLLTGSVACFDGDRFVLQADEADPALAVVRRLEGCIDSVTADTDDADSPVRIGDVPVRLDFWSHFDDRPTIKLFAGQIRSRALMERWARHLQVCCKKVGGLSSWIECTETSLPSGIDAATRWTAQDVGFSLNEQGMKEMRTYPLVEFFAHVGVQSYCWSEVRRGSRHAYHTWGVPLPMLVAAPVAAGAIPHLITRRFEFEVTPSGSNKTFNMSREAALRHAPAKRRG